MPVRALCQSDGNPLGTGILTMVPDVPPLVRATEYRLTGKVAASSRSPERVCLALAESTRT